MPPNAFLVRIKRLLEIDRSGKSPQGSIRTGIAKYAFHDRAPRGQGTDFDYSGFNAFALALGLDLLDAGFPQLEVVHLLRHIRNELVPCFNAALGDTGLAKRGSSSHPAPVPQVFMLLDRIELVERYSGIRKPLALKPRFFAGTDAVAQEIAKLGRARRRVFILETADTV